MRTSLVPVLLGLFMLGCGATTPDTNPSETASPTPSSSPTPTATPTPAGPQALGMICGGAMTCPDGYGCYDLDGDTSDGFCSIECPGAGAAGDTVCSDHYSFAETSVPACTLQDPSAGIDLCGLRCGDDAGNTDPPFGCPTGMTCGDLNNNGQQDLCVN